MLIGSYVCAINEICNVPIMSIQILRMMQMIFVLAILPVVISFGQDAVISPVSQTATSSSESDFDQFFINKALRLELYQTGDAHDETVTLRSIYEEPLWPENPHALISPFELGRYAIKVYDAASDRLIYYKGLDTMFAEYRTTGPAIAGVKRVFQTTARLPYPKKPVRVSFERRDRNNVLSSIFSTNIEPDDYHIIRESVDRGDQVFAVQKTGDPHDRVDFVFLSEGYTAADAEKFKKDVERFTSFLFTVEPYKSYREKFNVNGVFRPSAQRGVDEPRQHSFKSTILDAAYNSFDLDRYLLTEENHVLHRMAAQVPYDTIVILANTARYGGGSICLDYCISSVDHPTSERVFVHELGHSFAYLADEYVGTVAYNDRYPLGVEPLEPNITELLDPANVKWKALLSPGVALPTVEKRSEVRALEAELDAAKKNGSDRLADAKAHSSSDTDIQAIEQRNQSEQTAIEDKLTEAKQAAADQAKIVGAFEGAGYMGKGMYRPQMYCTMGNAGPTPGFCAVCRKALTDMIYYYAPIRLRRKSIEIHSQIGYSRNYSGDTTMHNRFVVVIVGGLLMVSFSGATSRSGEGCPI